MFERVDWSKRGEYMQRRHGIAPEVANDALGDPERVVIDPDYNSSTGESVRIIGFSILADNIITVIALEHEGHEYGVNGWVATPRIGASTTQDRTRRRKGTPMVNRSIDDLLTEEAKHAEEAELASDPDAPLPGHIKVTRGLPRARNLQVRFRDDEFAELAAYAEQRGLPISTVVRTLVLQAISPGDDLKTALDKLETDLAAVRRKALSA